MDTKYLDKLEYNQILKILASYCKTYIGKNLALNLMPYNNVNIVKKNLLETMQCDNLITRFGNLPICEFTNIDIYLKTLSSSGLLQTEALLALNKILVIAKDLKKYFSNEDLVEDDFNSLTDYFNCLYSNNSIIEKIEKTILDKDTIADNASTTLNSIRKNIRKLEQDIKDNLNSFIHSSKNSKYIQEPIITIRSGRYVIPIKEEYRSMIKGFIHDISSSGSTVFIEPISIFDMNNKIGDLHLKEHLEIEKILYELSKLFLPYIEELKTNTTIIGKLDFICAKALYSKDINAITPHICQTKEVRLINARHPLIDKEKVVPISVNLGIDFSTLVITGPNTGGKTVSLKTIGLLTCMACSGLNIPADNGSSVFVFDNVFADIGDNQSIANSLSTFSSHMLNIVDIVNNSTKNSLILVDELGSGTDPLEGANLAISILEYFNKNGSLTVATTHYQELKNFALVTKGFENASVEFDIDNLQPTYKLLVGIPGKSNAFAISKKLGLPQSIIDNASKLISSEDISIEELLKSIYDNKIKIEKEKEEIDKNLVQITNLRKQLERDNSELKNKEKDLINSAKNEARNILLQAKDEATEVIKKLNDISSSSNISNVQNIRNKLNSDIKAYSSFENTTNSSTPSLNINDIYVGLPVYITTLNQHGIVASNVSKSNEVQVQIGSMKTNINIKYLQKDTNIKKAKNISNSYTKISKAKSATDEINVIGLNVDEACFAIDKFLDDCYLAKLKTIRIVHGKGTGKLREGIHKFLKANTHVKSFRIGTFGEGEMGVTIVELK